MIMMKYQQQQQQSSSYHTLRRQQHHHHHHQQQQQQQRGRRLIPHSRMAIMTIFIIVMYSLLLVQVVSAFHSLSLLHKTTSTPSSSTTISRQHQQQQQQQRYQFHTCKVSITDQDKETTGTISSTDTTGSSSTSSNSNTINDMNMNMKSNVPDQWEDEVYNTLRTIIDPDLNNDIVSLGFIQNLQLISKVKKNNNNSNNKDDTSDPSSISTGDDDDDNKKKNHMINVISFNVELTTPACPIKEQFQIDCQNNVLQLSWVDEVLVTMTSRSISNDNNISNNGMGQVKSIIAVSSCKGGVGKSTTAVNVAFALQQMGAKVGIFDTDIYGPSLPTMVIPDHDTIQFVGRQIAPLQRNDVKLMSFGYISDDAAIMRGPMIQQLLDQIIGITHWGTIDYLIIDMPPGTGDIALSLTQRLNITAAIIVTTPQELSYTDVVRGINMFDSVNVPCIAVVENMAYYEIPSKSTSTTTTIDVNKMIDTNQLKESIMNKLMDVDELKVNKPVNDDKNVETSTNTKIDVLGNELVELVIQQLNEQNIQRQTLNSNQQDTTTSSITEPEKIPIFGVGHTKRLATQFGIEHIYQMPLISNIAKNGDTGTPYILDHPNATSTKIYYDLAKSVVTEVAKIQYIGTSQRPQIQYNQEDHVIVVDNIISTDIKNESPATTDTSSKPREQQQQQQQQQYKITPANLRRICHCASCVEEMTGRQLLIPTTILEMIYPKKIYPTGNYACSIDWSDGHQSLYPYKQIKTYLQQQQQNQ